jgi:hypothetical protein
MIDTSVQGKRVRLDYTSDPYTHLKPGAEGTADFWNKSSLGDTLAVTWDDGSTLSLLVGEDKFTFLT